MHWRGPTLANFITDQFRIMHVLRGNTWSTALPYSVCIDCPSGFPCDDFGCTLLRTDRCDGKIDCRDRSDEDNCIPGTDASFSGGSKFHSLNCRCRGQSLSSIPPSSLQPLVTSSPLASP